MTPSLCTLISYDEASRALGAAVVGATDTADAGNLNPGCSWMASAPEIGAQARILVFTVWRKAGLDRQGASLSGPSLYAHNVGDLEDEFGAAAPLYGVGDEAMIAVAPKPKAAFEGRIVARKGEDVLTMQLTGADRASFEALARKIAKAM
jgi:hypothetical protein